MIYDANPPYDYDFWVSLSCSLPPPPVAPSSSGGRSIHRGGNLNKKERAVLKQNQTGQSFSLILKTMFKTFCQSGLLN